MLKEKTWDEIQNLLTDEARFQVLERLRNVGMWPNVLGLIFFENIDCGSSHMGESLMLVYGPSYTIEAIEPVIENPMKYHLNDLPSVRQYPQWYITRAGYLGGKSDDSSA